MAQKSRVVITNLGLINSIANDSDEFCNALKIGKSGISKLKKIPSEKILIKIGGEIVDFDWRDHLDKLKNSVPDIYKKARKALNNSTFSTRISSCAAIQAFLSTQLNQSKIDPEDVGIVVAGNNINQKYIIDNYKKFLKEPEYINPLYALSYLDTNLVGSISEILTIKGLGYTVGGSSASGNLGIINAYHLIKHGYVKACLAVGALADFSELELQAFSILGAMNGTKYNDFPQKASRPFDKNHDGFVYGQGSGCIVLESLEHALKRGACILGEIVGASIVLDGNHLSNPSLEGEAKAMRKALEEAHIDYSAIQYINAHGTSSPLGDETELAAIKEVFKDRIKDIYINSTKSMIGHCIYSAGIIEMIATILQMNDGFLHPNLNLDEPFDPDFLFVGRKTQKADIEHALSNSFGFGGINSSIVLKKISKEGAI